LLTASLHRFVPRDGVAAIAGPAGAIGLGFRGKRYQRDIRQLTAAGGVTSCGSFLSAASLGRKAMAQDTELRRHKRGGIYFDDFVVGHLYEHPLTRTVTQMDNMLFSNMTLNPQPLHIDRHFCEQETEWGQPLMNSLFTLGLMIGIMVNDLTVGTTIANLGMTEVKFPHPLFEGDTVHVTTEVISKRESTSRPGAGIIEFHHRAYNQDNKLVAECRRQVFMRMRPR
jgi:acyl dehydratase